MKKYVTLSNLATVTGRKMTTVRCAWSFMNPTVRRYRGIEGHPNAVFYELSDITAQMRVCADSFWEDSHEQHLQSLAVSVPAHFEAQVV